MGFLQPTTGCPHFSDTHSGINLQVYPWAAVHGTEEAAALAKDDIIDTLKDGMSLASRMAVRGVGEVAKTLKPQKDSRGTTGESGLYWQRHLHPLFGRLVPTLEHQEPQQPRRLIAGMLKNLAVPAAERAFVAGCQALLRGSLDEARERMDEAYNKDAQFTDAYFMHGAVSLALDDFGEAVHTLKKVLLTQAKLSARIKKYLPSLRMTLCLTENSSFALYPDLLGTNVLLSLALRGRGESEEAANVLDQLLGVMPDHPVVGFFLACHHIEAARWSAAVELLKDTLPDDNITLANLILLGKSCVASGDSATAVEIYRKVLSRTDFDPQLMVDVRYNLGKALARAGQSGEAEAEFERITRMYPAYLDLLERLGVEPESRKRKAIPVVRPPAALPVASSAPTQAAPPPPPPEEVHEAEFTMQPAPPAGLALVSSDGRVRFSLQSSPVVLGREEGDIVLGWDSAASHLHARLILENGGWWAEDLGSTNGTMVNGHRIGGKVLLNRGDMLTVGQTQFRLE